MTSLRVIDLPKLYVLDGIHTAFRQKVWEEKQEPYSLVCGCGWEYNCLSWYSGVADLEPLRFHYTHCPKAKLHGNP